MLRFITFLGILASTTCYNIMPTPNNLNKANRILFKFDFPDISTKNGIKHIHFPEHIKHAHGLGAPFFEINKVYEPKNKTICFDCETLGRHFEVTQYSNTKYDSTLVFRRKYVESKNPFLKLKFIVKPYNDDNSHILYINFIFWNSLYYLFYPFLPAIVFTNSLEDKFFFANNKNKDIIEDEKFIKYRDEVMK